MAFCKFCGAEIPESANFCTQCGQKFSESEKEITSGTSDNDGKASGQAEISSEPLVDNTDVIIDGTDENSSEANAKSKKCKPKITVFSVIAKAFSILFSVVFAVVVLSAGIVSVFQQTVNPNNIKTTVKDIVFKGIGEAHELKIENSDGEELPITEYVLDLCNEEVKEEFGINTDSVVSIINETNADEFVCTLVADCFSKILDNEDIKEDSINRIIDWVDENRSTIKTVTDYEITLDDLGTLRGELEQSELLDVIDKENIQTTVDELTSGVLEFDALKIIFSIWPYVVVLGTALLIALIIFALNRFSLRSIFTYITVSLAVVGGIEIILAAVLSILNINFDIGIDIVDNIISMLSKPFAIRGAILFVIGLVSTIVYKTVSSKKSKV